MAIEKCFTPLCTLLLLLLLLMAAGRLFSPFYSILGHFFCRRSLHSTIPPLCTCKNVLLFDYSLLNKLAQYSSTSTRYIIIHTHNLCISNLFEHIYAF